MRVGLRGALRGVVGDGDLERLLGRDVHQRGGDEGALRVNRPRGGGCALLHRPGLGRHVGEVGVDGAAPDLEARGGRGGGVLDLDGLDDLLAAQHALALDRVGDLERLERGGVAGVVALGLGAGEGREGGGHHGEDDGGDLHGFGFGFGIGWAGASCVCTWGVCACRCLDQVIDRGTAVGRDQPRPSVPKLSIKQGMRRANVNRNGPRLVKSGRKQSARAHQLPVRGSIEHVRKIWKISSNTKEKAACAFEPKINEQASSNRIEDDDDAVGLDRAFERETAGD